VTLLRFGDGLRAKTPRQLNSRLAEPGSAFDIAISFNQLSLPASSSFKARPIIIVNAGKPDQRTVR